MQGKLIVVVILPELVAQACGQLHWHCFGAFNMRLAVGYKLLDRKVISLCQIHSITTR